MSEALTRQILDISRRFNMPVIEAAIASEALRKAHDATIKARSAAAIAEENAKNAIEASIAANEAVKAAEEAEMAILEIVKANREEPSSSGSGEKKYDPTCHLVESDSRSSRPSLPRYFDPMAVDIYTKAVGAKNVIMGVFDDPQCSFRYCLYPAVTTHLYGHGYRWCCLECKIKAVKEDNALPLKPLREM